MQIYAVLSKAGLCSADALVDQLFSTEATSAADCPAVVERYPQSVLTNWLERPSLVSNEARFRDRIIGSFVANSATCWIGVGGRETFCLEAKEVQTGDATDNSSHAQSMCHDVSTGMPCQAMQSPAHTLACHLDTCCHLWHISAKEFEDTIIVRLQLISGSLIFSAMHCKTPFLELYCRRSVTTTDYY